MEEQIIKTAEELRKSLDEPHYEAHINLFPARIIDWLISRDGFGKVWKVIRADRSVESYKNIDSLVKSCDKEDFDTLWKLVQLKLTDAKKADVKEHDLWVELKRLYELDANDIYWDFPKKRSYHNMKVL